MVTKWIGVGFMGFGLVWLVIGGGIMLAGGSAEAAGGTGRIFALMSLGFLATGGLMVGAGLLMSRAAKQRTALIETQGVSAKGTVTRVEPNWNVRVNGRPVYSIVEFTFTDSSGGPRQVRKTRIGAGLAANSQIAPGSEVEVKYLMGDPRQCGLVLTDSTTGGTTLAV